MNLLDDALKEGLLRLGGEESSSEWNWLSNCCTFYAGIGAEVYVLGSFYNLDIINESSRGCKQSSEFIALHIIFE